MVVDPVILGEIRFGILLLSRGKRRSRLERWFDEGVRRLHCLPWEGGGGLGGAGLPARLRAWGRGIRTRDGRMAAPPLTNRLTIATRNVTDFEKAGCDVVNPFEP